ncbi:HIT domain-containing protein [Pseudactinotalea sp. HY158]|uniref:HIT family protein n=1 Tax=Pseudactinotalea sp. HY158 TaxID=2654547 RepID=UPI00129CBBF6|nr:HIT domain-containing protein [Pseudactinotalea sp. HY158]QGH69329.1 HIT domain-containing protein [Pseudactinotalea sp. HY158]
MSSPDAAGDPSPEGPRASGPLEAAADFPRIEDGVDRLWTPHRLVYIDGEAKVTSTAPADCPFCLAPRREDADALIVARGSTCYVILNLFPYNPGHLLVCPYRHVGDYTDLTREERYESADLVARSMTVLRTAKAPSGFNLGMNQGAGAGAGVAAHAHQHVVPRWDGDANFLPVIGRTKALPELLADTRDQLARAWDLVSEREAGAETGGEGHGPR